MAPQLQHVVELKRSKTTYCSEVAKLCNDEIASCKRPLKNHLIQLNIPIYCHNDENSLKIINNYAFK